MKKILPAGWSAALKEYLDAEELLLDMRKRSHLAQGLLDVGEK